MTFEMTANARLQTHIQLSGFESSGRKRFSIQVSNCFKLFKELSVIFCSESWFAVSFYSWARELAFMKAVRGKTINAK